MIWLDTIAPRSCSPYRRPVPPLGKIRWGHAVPTPCSAVGGRLIEPGRFEHESMVAWQVKPLYLRIRKPLRI